VEKKVDKVIVSDTGDVTNELLDYELMDHGSKLTRDEVVHIETVANLCGKPVSSK